MAQRPSCILSSLILTCAVAGVFFQSLAASAAPDEPRAALTGHRVPDAAAGRLAGHVEATRPVTLAFVLPLRNQADLSDLLTRLYDPRDPQYQHFLSVAEFADKFGPSLSDVNAVAEYAKSQGLTVTEITANHALVTATGPASAVESALGVRLNDYVAANGTRFRAPDREPTLPRSIAARLLDLAGTDTLPRARPFIHQARPALTQALSEVGLAQPHLTGTGHFGSLAPSNIRQIYGMNSISYTGAGQTLALFELDGYTPGDITTFENYYGIPAVPLQNITLDGFNGQPTPNGASEVTLDIDMALSTAPGLSKILVYEADDSTAGTIAAYNRIASDNAAGVVSTSWGSDEGTAEAAGSEITAEYNAFMEMAMQGQSNFAAAGDAGAYDNTTTLSVDDPGSQPYMCDVGATDVTVSNSLNYISESAWGDMQDTTYDMFGTGGGGGISSKWTIPSYQSGTTGAAGSLVSTMMRNVPDVSLYGDFDTGGYDVYFTTPPTSGVTTPPPQWTGYNGSSAAAPLWAGYMARVNQARAAKGQSRIGFANPLIYVTAKNASKYAADFHDIADGTTNLYYPAKAGYDLATGWGSPQSAALLADLSASANTWSAGDIASAVDGTARILWKRSDGAAGLWSLDSSDNQSVVGPTYGPYTDSSGYWTAQSVTVAPDATSRILWTRSDGAAGVWTMSTSDAQTAAGPIYGPFADSHGTWAAADIAVDGAGTRMLWRRSDGAAGLWTMSTAGRQTLVGPTYGPYPGWTATGVSAGADNTARILWTRTDGAAGLWTMSAGNAQTIVGPTYGPYAGWKAVDVGTAGNGSSTMLWTNSSGTAGLWSFNASDVETTIGSDYGPYAGYTAAQSDLSPTGTTRILWSSSSRSAFVWSLDTSDTVTTIGSTYGPY